LGRTEGDEDDHPDTDVDFATTFPVLEDSTSGIDVVGNYNEILEEIVVTEGESDGGVHETGSISGEATLMWNVGRYFSERSHNEVTDKANETVPEEQAEGTTSARMGFELARRRLAGWSLTGRAPFRIR
jgi:hypothetical protein